MAWWMLVGLVLSCVGCERLAGLNFFPITGRPADRDIQALAISPSVEYATVIDLGRGRRLFRSDRDLLYAQGDQFYPIVMRGFPRLVGISPNGNAVAFLEPAEFETAANLYVFDLPARSLRALTNHPDDQSTVTVRLAKWFDDRTVYYLEGYRYGTVSQGGDLWRVDVRTLVRMPVIKATSAEQGRYREIVDFEFVPGSRTIRYDVAEYDEHGEETIETLHATLGGHPVR